MRVWVRIGEDRSERLDIIPARYQVIVTIRPRYACPKGRTGVLQAAAPAHLLERSWPTEALLAHIAVAKHSEHMPLNRQAVVMARHGVPIDRSVLADWMGHGCPDRAGGRSHGRVAEERKLPALCRRDDGPGSRSRTRQDEDWLPVGLCCAMTGVGVAPPRPVSYSTIIPAVAANKFGRARRQEDWRDVVGHVEVCRCVPTGPVEKENGVGAPGDMAGYLIEMQLHGLSVGVWHGNSCPGSSCRTYGAKEIGILIALIGRLAGP